LLVDLPFQLSIGFLAVSTQIGFSLDARPGTQFAVPDGVSNAMTLPRSIPELTALGAMATASEGEITSLATGSSLPEQVRKAAFLS
jgi:hypothetical protein